MLNEKVEVEIRGYRLTIEMEGLTPIEVNSLASQVHEKMKEIERDTEVVHTYKLALMAALAFAAELSRLKSNQDHQRSSEERKLDEMIVSLQNGLEAR